MPASRPLLLVLAVALAACGGDAARPADRPAATTTNAAEEAANRARVDSLAAAGGTIDSIIPLDEALRRFREPLGPAPDTLRHAARSVREVADRWLRAATAADTTALVRLAVDRAEFAWLFYPGTSLAKPPYEMPPSLMWSQFVLNSDDGVRKVLRVLGGTRTELVSLRCPEPPVREGDNTLHENCLVTLRVDGRTLPEVRAFGTILERDGRFKLLGLSSKL